MLEIKNFAEILNPTFEDFKVGLREFNEFYYNIEKAYSFSLEGKDMFYVRLEGRVIYGSFLNGLKSDEEIVFSIDGKFPAIGKAYQILDKIYPLV